MSAQIHIVMGTTGEYSYRTEWAVAAYFDKAKADKHADLASTWSIKEAKARGKRGYYDLLPVNPHDANYKCDGLSGTDYYTISVDLVDAIPGIDC